MNHLSGARDSSVSPSLNATPLLHKSVVNNKHPKSAWKKWQSSDNFKKKSTIPVALHQKKWQKDL
jgi:hypothetical protein